MLKSRGGGMQHLLLSPGTTCIKSDAPLKPERGCAGVSNDWCITDILIYHSIPAASLLIIFLKTGIFITIPCCRMQAVAKRDNLYTLLLFALKLWLFRLRNDSFKNIDNFF